MVPVPPAINVYNFLEFFPFQVISLPHYHILFNELMAAISDSLIVHLVSVTSESLNLMTYLAPVDSIGKNIAIVGLVALAPTQWTHLVTS